MRRCLSIYAASGSAIGKSRSSAVTSSVRRTSGLLARSARTPPQRARTAQQADQAAHAIGVETFERIQAQDHAHAVLATPLHCRNDRRFERGVGIRPVLDHDGFHTKVDLASPRITACRYLHADSLAGSTDECKCLHAQFGAGERAVAGCGEARADGSRCGSSAGGRRASRPEIRLVGRDAPRPAGRRGLRAARSAALSRQHDQASVGRRGAGRDRRAAIGLPRIHRHRRGCEHDRERRRFTALSGRCRRPCARSSAWPSRAPTTSRPTCSSTSSAEIARPRSCASASDCRHQFHRKLSGSEPLIDDPAVGRRTSQRHPAADAARLLRSIAGDACRSPPSCAKMLAAQPWNDEAQPRPSAPAIASLHKTGDTSEVTHDGGILIDRRGASTSSSRTRA